MIAAGRRSNRALADTTSLRTALAPLIVLPAAGFLLLRNLREPAAPSLV